MTVEERMREIIRASRLDPARLGLKGKPGFMGRGIYSTNGRRPGYLKGR